MSENALTVYTDDALSGQLTRDPQAGPATFFSYQTDRPERAVSLTMPTGLIPYAWDRGLHPIFDMNLPEGELRSALSRRFKKAIAGFDDFDLLRVTGAYQLGRVSTNLGVSQREVPAVNLRDLATYEGADDLAAHLIQEYAAYSGVSGVQPKVLVRNIADPETHLSRLTHRSATHIVKTWNPDEFPYLAENEFFCMRAAQAAGLKVPKYSLSDNGRLFIIERFDIDDEGNYLGFEDFCVLSGWPSSAKYDGTYEGCAKIIKAFVSEQHASEALTDYFKGLVLSCAVRNGDHHMKNLGVLYRSPVAGAEVNLAPTYDIVSTTPYIAGDSLALLFGGSKRWPTADRLLDFGRQHCFLSNSQAKAVLEQVADALSDVKIELKERAADNPGFAAEVGQKMLEIWEQGASNLHNPRPKSAPRRRRPPKAQ